MSASDSNLSAMEETSVAEEERGSLPDASDSPATALFPYLPSPAPTRPNSTSDTILESKAISVASIDFASSLSSPAEASPAKRPTSVLEEGYDQSPTTSNTATATATEGGKCAEARLMRAAELPPWSSSVPSDTFGCSELMDSLPAVLTVKGVSVTLENNSIWKQFHQCGTEMILSKQGRRMFPYCRYRLSGLNPEQRYSLILSIVPSSAYKYRWTSCKWELSGPAENESQGLIRAFSHHYSPIRGSDWMNCLISFYKLKLTNNFQDQEGHVILHSMHRYIPRLHIIPIPDGETPSGDLPVVLGPESLTFTFPQTEFMAVTTYQNFRITQLKINHNPFAKGFREDGNNSRLQRVFPLVAKTESQPNMKPTQATETNKEDAADTSTKSECAPASSSNLKENRLVLKPIMSNPSNNDDLYTPCMRGKHALGKLMLVENQGACDRPLEGSGVDETPEGQKGFRSFPKATTASSSSSTPRSTPQYRKKRRKIKRRWGQPGLNLWKAKVASPRVVHSPSLTAAMQPELDDVEGLLFVSFTSKEALDLHVRDKSVSTAVVETPVPPTEQMKTQPPVPVSEEVSPETTEEKIAGMESVLLSDLMHLKHRQVIHPVLQEVGLKLSSLEPTLPVDLQYVGVTLPLPDPSLPEQSNTASQSPDEGLPFISRTGKTSDMTKIKGWRNKFVRREETSTHGEGPQKNLSAFCSDMLDEYLQSESHKIGNHVDPFCTDPESSVTYELPDKGSSYVKTLDSVLKHQNSTIKTSVANRPCPLSRKSLPNSTVVSNPAASLEISDEPEAQSRQPEVTQKPAANFGQFQGLAFRSHLSLPQIQLKMQQIELSTLNQGLNRTRLTPERLQVALSVLMTKQTLPQHELREVPLLPNSQDLGCGREFCRFGCICASLLHLNHFSVHCRRPECMIECICSKVTAVIGHKTHPRLPTLVSKLWTPNILDVEQEAVNRPKSSQPFPKVLPHTLQAKPLPREEDKDPVYKYLESMLTCARVREFNSQPPPAVSLHTKLLDALSAQKDVTKAQNSAQTVPTKNSFSETTERKSGGRPYLKVRPIELGARKQIQIQSFCQWRNDRKMVLEGLYARLNRNRLHQRFHLGPYYIKPISRICINTPTGSTVTYRVQISKPTNLSDCEEDESDEGDEKPISDCANGKTDEEEDDTIEESEKLYGVIPFLRGVTPAGRLRAKKKPAGCRASGLIQVNNKYYDHATLLVGNLGSLHPTNRLAAHVTGRLQADKILKNQALAPKTAPTNTTSASTDFPPGIKVHQTIVKPIANLPLSGSINKKTSNSAKDSLHSQSPNPSLSFAPIKQNHQRIPTMSPVCLTVSPSLKNPRFLEESGTYSFRICPPSSLGEGGQKLPGVTLPGGYTIVDIPKPGLSESSKSPPHAVKGSEEQNNADVSPLSLLAKKPTPERSASDEVSAGVSAEKQSNHDDALEEWSSDFSDYDESEEGGTVDVETVEAKQEEAAGTFREDVLQRLKQSRESSDEFGQMKELSDLYQMKFGYDPLKTMKRRTDHCAVEKLRRCEQRVLFERLQSLLKSQNGTSKLCLLSQAEDEIKSLDQKCKALEEEKERLSRIQSAYLKKLSLLAGKPEQMIQNKLKEICERQKQREISMKWKPFFSHMLQTKAVLLQATSDPQLSPHKKHDFQSPSPPEPPAITPNNLKMLLALVHSKTQKENPESQPSPTPVAAQTGTVPPAQTEPGTSAQAGPTVFKLGGIVVRDGSGDQDRAQKSNYLIKLPPQALLDKSQEKPSASLNGDLTGSPGASQGTSQLLSAKLPLIRSKTGRIILPASLKPLGRGFYTLMVMEPKPKAPVNEAPLPNADSTKTLEGTVSTSDPNSGDKEKCASSDSDSTHLDPVKHDNKPAAATQDAVVNQQSGTGGNLLKTAHLVFNQCSFPSLQVNPDPSSPVAACHTDGSPKQPPPLSSSDKQEAPVRPTATNIKADKTSNSNKVVRVVVKAIKTTKTTQKVLSQEGEKPEPVKPRRGRPPKRKSDQQPLGKRNAASPSNSSDDSLVRFSIGNTNNRTSRPLTRASLGKDFPSAKKRSWIDVEKELEPDMEEFV